MYPTATRNVTLYKCSMCDSTVVVDRDSAKPVCHHLEMTPLYNYTETLNGGQSDA